MNKNSEKIEYKNNNYRKLEITNYRNLGIDYDGKSGTDLILNRSLKKEELGDLVFLVGPNNSGKSNVLRAMLAYSEGSIAQDDYSELIINDLEPKIKFIVRAEDVIYSPDLRLDLSAWDFLTESPFLAAIKSLTDRNKFKYACEEGFAQNLIGKNDIEFVDYIEALESILQRAYSSHPLDSSHCEFLLNMLDFEEMFDQETAYAYRENMRYANRRVPGLGVETMDGKHVFEDVEALAFEAEYGYRMTPNVVEYHQEKISQIDLSCNPDSPNPFISTVLRIMEKSSNALKNVYENYRPKKRSNLLTTFTRELNEDVDKRITEKFNRLYMCGDSEKYKFEFKASPEEFSLEIYHGGRPIDLDKQSTGFRWFFDFYFNFISKGNLVHGDIIVMDEPATSLHISGQMELRKYLKDFAKRLGLTFVISTHSPFLLDCDYLDEIRLLHINENGHAHIDNKFSVIADYDGVNTLDPILKALTVGRHILIDPGQKVIFVEGITDYNYLTAFKLINAPLYDKLTFLPVNGIKRPDIIEALLRIDKAPILLVDGDNEGDKVVENSKNTALSVITLSSIDMGFSEIEKLFTVEDRNTFNVYNKSWDDSSTFKNNISKHNNALSKTTKDRFAILLDRLLYV